MSNLCLAPLPSPFTLLSITVWPPTFAPSGLLPYQTRRLWGGWQRESEGVPRWDTAWFGGWGSDHTSKSTNRRHVTAVSCGLDVLPCGWESSPSFQCSGPFISVQPVTSQPVVSKPKTQTKTCRYNLFWRGKRGSTCCPPICLICRCWWVYRKKQNNTTLPVRQLRSRSKINPFMWCFIWADY